MVYIIFILNLIILLMLVVVATDVFVNNTGGT